MTFKWLQFCSIIITKNSVLAGKKLKKINDWLKKMWAGRQRYLLPWFDKEGHFWLRGSCPGILSRYLSEINVTWQDLSLIWIFLEISSIADLFLSKTTDYTAHLWKVRPKPGRCSHTICFCSFLKLATIWLVALLLKELSPFSVKSTCPKFPRGF